MNQFRWLMQKMVDAESHEAVESHEAGAIFHLHFGPLFWNPLESAARPHGGLQM